MNQPSWKLETLLYALAFLLALAIRFLFLAQAPLSNPEAELALQALDLARGQETLLAPQPAYLVLTTAGMFLFGASTWVARFWPALIGSLLVWAPFLFRRRLGTVPALLLAFFMAVDPGLAAVSRQAGGEAMAVSFLLLAFGFWWSGRSVWAGILAGLALLSGPAIWPGVLALALALGIASPRSHAASLEFGY